MNRYAEPYAAGSLGHPGLIRKADQYIAKERYTPTSPDQQGSGSKKPPDHLGMQIGTLLVLVDSTCSPAIPHFPLLLTIVLLPSTPTPGTCLAQKSIETFWMATASEAVNGGWGGRLGLREGISPSS